MNRAEEQFRIEHDPLGEAHVPADALYGIQTKRALDNFRISHLRVNPGLIKAFAEIKKAAAEADMETGAIACEIGEAVARAADEFISGRHNDQFKLDVFQAGAGASYNMNVNEALANRALELLGSRLVRREHRRTGHAIRRRAWLYGRGRTGRPRDSFGKKHSRTARRGSQEGRTQDQG
jgi:aspartate ammonia-lyase